MGDDGSAPPRVLFVCTGNTCRSVLAEYLGRHMFGKAVMFESAGIRPQPAKDADNAVCTLKQKFNIDASDHVPRDVRAVELSRFSLIIALDKEAVRVVRGLGAQESTLKLWKVQDPYGDDLTAYGRAGLEIMKKLKQLRASGQDSD
ncbi:low molecular weight phosphatase family protein [Nitrospira sp. BLG_2]|uniref:arsenate-mycothiol transferase ArsC n=1 Tax=Nitrospira sp. BLG_2 TaxID=3397507 RepID=UPI003B99F222